MMGVNPAPAIAGIGTFLFSLIMLVGMCVGWVILLVAAWRGMKAHESIAESLKRIADQPS